jgi:hypothetical protein
MFPSDVYFDYVSDDQEEGAESEDVTFDQKEIIKKIGKIAADFMREQYDQITGAQVVGTFSPSFYNYTTDSAEIEIEADMDAIRAYCIDKKWEDQMEKIDDDVWMMNGIYIKDQAEAMLLFYIKDLATDEMINDYTSSVYDVLFEIYNEAIMDPEPVAVV